MSEVIFSRRNKDESNNRLDGTGGLSVSDGEPENSISTHKLGYIVVGYCIIIKPT
jgi:hypothetical protein